jgi:hypothetical protein
LIDEPPPVLYAGQAQGSSAFVGIVKRQDRYRAYVSDATAKRATLSVWFRGGLSADGRVSATSYGVTLDARLARRQATGMVTLPDGRIFAFAAKSGFGGGLVERNYVFEDVRYRSGWIVLEDNRVRGRTMVLGAALDSTSTRTEPEVTLDTLRAQRGRLLRQSGIWELRLNKGRGSSAAYNRLTQVIGFLDETILELES